MNKKIAEVAANEEQPVREYLDVSLLDFDPTNPRFSPDVSSGPVPDLIERFIRDERLLEIVTSIADQGFFDGEPLLVVRHDSRYVVVEGNRRLAALKLLNSEIEVPAGRTSVVDIVEAATHRPPKVPCLIFSNPDRILRYLGFRHITGIKSWSSLQKARYLKKLRDTFYDAFEGRAKLTALAREIGSRPDYVGQMLTALNLYERAEKLNFYGVKGLDPNEIEFSVLSTALSYKNITNYVGLEGRQDSEGAAVSDENLKHLLTWMFVARGDNKSALGESRNLKQLAAVVESKAAIKILLDTGSLESAFQMSRGPSIALNLSLKSVEKKLNEIWQLIPQLSRVDSGDGERAEEIRKLSTRVRDAIRSVEEGQAEEGQSNETHS
jgi:hypothetical protein